ncbi:MAG: CoA pyrophosphatase [Bacteroides sp.]|jgi:8-oxo-dGTP pyrophosphatase MutT (NUDIX family)|nr:CoA pyrophosphatase [Bacteroides sp.]
MSVVQNSIIPDRITKFSAFVPFLRSLPFHQLPGMESQLRMAPTNRKQEIMSLGKGKGATQSAVLFLFYPLANGNTSTVFIQRPQYNGAHSGQIAFPGGRFEPNDPGLEFTALRETHEEVGVHPGSVEMVGKLSDLFIPPSNYIVSPYVGITMERPQFIADPLEVESILEIELSDFFQPTHCQTRELTLIGGYRLQTPCYVINEQVIWGATAMMISEFLALIEKG